MDTLRRFDIRESDLETWENVLGLNIPMDEYGRKQYSPHHINLFKNVRKHLALGRTLDEIKKIISLPPLTQSHPKAQATPTVPATIPRPQQVARPKSGYASVPTRPQVQGKVPGNGASSVVNLVNQLTREKDQLYKKLMEAEKLNSHLYSANNMFHRRVKEMTGQIQQLREISKEDQNIKLMDDKARLHKQLISAEKMALLKEEEVNALRQELKTLQAQIQIQEDRIKSMTQDIQPEKFCGDWMESGSLIEIVYDNFGINIESERVRLFRIAEPPQRTFGNTAVVNTSYQYETNTLWKRNESLVVAYIDDNTLEGEVIAEYILDGVPVAKALYRVTCTRNN